MAVLNSNPYFETTAAPWTSADGTAVRTTVDSHEGVASLLLTPNGTGPNPRAESEKVDIQLDTTYYASAWVRCAASRSVDVGIAWYNAGNSLISIQVQTTSVAANIWTQIGIALDPPPTAVRAALMVRMTGTPPAGHLLYIDEAKLTVMTLTAEHNYELNSPGFILTVEDIVPTRAWIRIIRTDLSGSIPDEAVRGADGVPITASPFIVTDYEGPAVTGVEYIATAWDDGVDPDTADPTEVDVAESGFIFPPEVFFVTDTWLKSVSQPALSQKVNVIDWNQVSNPGRVLGEYDVLGRRNKVVIRDVTGGREGTVVFGAFLVDGDSFNSFWKDLKTLLELGGTLLLQTGGESWTGERDMYFEVKSIRRTRIGPISALADLTFLFEVDYVEVDRPNTADESLGLVSWQDILDAYFDWQDVRDSNSTWLDLLS